MKQQGTVQITDKDGWRKTFPLQKSLVHIGSDPKNDVVLGAWHGGGVSQRHLQLIAVPGEGQRYRAVNLDDAGIPLGQSGDRVLSPHSMVEIASGESLRLGDFTLVFHFSEVGGSAIAPATGAQAVPMEPAPPSGDTSQDLQGDAIGLRFSLPSPVLRPEHPLEGIVSVRNLGNQPGVQFKLEVDGWEPDCYQIGPGPILFPNVEKGVFLQIEHPRGPTPPAGRHQIRIRATAPETYPGEIATVIREIEVLPYYHHVLRLLTKS